MGRRCILDAVGHKERDSDFAHIAVKFRYKLSSVARYNDAPIASYNSMMASFSDTQLHYIDD